MQRQIFVNKLYKNSYKQNYARKSLKLMYLFRMRNVCFVYNVFHLLYRPSAICQKHNVNACLTIPVRTDHPTIKSTLSERYDCGHETDLGATQSKKKQRRM
jgi:hypothetical protein